MKLWQKFVALNLAIIMILATVPVSSVQAAVLSLSEAINYESVDEVHTFTPTESGVYEFELDGETIWGSSWITPAGLRLYTDVEIEPLQTQRKYPEINQVFELTGGETYTITTDPLRFVSNYEESQHSEWWTYYTNYELTIEDITDTFSVKLANAVLYVNYESEILTNNDNIVEGKLPKGLGIYSDGTILGIPTELGTFEFVVERNGTLINYEITVVENENVESKNDFEIIERVATVESNAQNYIYEVSGEFDDFLAVYINGKKLVENVDYYAEEGSTKITILSQTVATLPSGTNTINATFSANSGSVATVTPVVQSVAQNFTKTVEPVETSSMPFTDVAMSDWYYDSVEYIYKRDIMNGTASTLFTPNSNINHAMLVTILYRMSGETASTESKYTDVVSDFWYTDAINWAVDNNITTPKTSTTFAPNELLNREQTAVIVKNYCDYMKIYLPMTTSAEVPDLENVSDSAKDAVTEMYQRGFLQGDANGNFNPTNNITRAQVATMINNFLMKI